MAILQLGKFFSLGVEPQPAQLPSLANVAWKTRAEMIAEAKLQTRAIDSYTSYPGLEAQLLAVQGLTDRPWRYPSVREALGVPAIFRAVTLISNTTGSLGMEAYRSGIKLPDDQVPQLIKRPDPFRIPRDFYRDTAFHLASRGEFWWWVAARDSDGRALSLIVVPPWEVQIDPTDDRLRPKILWLNREMRRENMRHGTFQLDENGLRGVGPLQLCGAALSVAVEAQEWAANFYAEGGHPSITIKSAVALDETEATALKTQWTAQPNNVPRVIDPGIEEVKEFGVNEQGAQMLEAREYNNGDAARMFGIPGSLLEYSSPGSSLTYQNLEQEFMKFVRACLAPDYLVVIEQHMSDLLARNTAARFDVAGFQRADVKTRWEVYKLATEVLGQTEAAEIARIGEGLVPGDVEFSAIPFSSPAAVPDRLPVNTRSVAEEIRCDGRRMFRGILTTCGKRLNADWEGKCPRCKKQYPTVAA